MEFRLKTECIALDNLLKAAGIAASGSAARQLIESGAVTVNGAAEARIRRKLRPGDTVACGGDVITILAQSRA